MTKFKDLCERDKKWSLMKEEQKIEALLKRIELLESKLNPSESNKKFRRICIYD